jgi:DNA polymerase-4
VRLSGDLERKGYVARTIGLKLRYDNFKTVTRDCTLDASTREAKAIRRAAGECLKRVRLDRRIRLLGVRVGALSRAGESSPEVVSNRRKSLPLFGADGDFSAAHK